MKKILIYTLFSLLVANALSAQNVQWKATAKGDSLYCEVHLND